MHNEISEYINIDFFLNSHKLEREEVQPFIQHLYMTGTYFDRFLLDIDKLETWEEGKNI